VYGELLAVGRSAAVAGYIEDGRIVVRRTTDSGATWGPKITVPRSFLANDPRFASRGRYVDVLFAKNQRLRYSRSSNRGASFGAPIVLRRPSPDLYDVNSKGVARGPNGMVAVVWTEGDRVTGGSLTDARVRFRISNDGGATFGTTKTLATGAVGRVTVGMGNGVVYVAYVRDGARIELRRSLDSGASWEGPLTVATFAPDVIPGGASSFHANSMVRITAKGQQAYVSYDAQEYSSRWVRYRRTTDKGASWSSPVDLSSPAENPSYGARISLHGGVARAVFGRCINETCEAVSPFERTPRIFYRESANGTTWTPAEEASHRPSHALDEYPMGVAFAGKVLVLYTSNTFYVRAGTP
jgi:hypothetical protein